MRPKRLALPVAGIFLSLCVQGAIAGEFSDPSGFSVTFPDKWIAINKYDQNLKDAAQKFVKNNNIDFTKVKVVLMGDSNAVDFIENVNVLVQAPELPAIQQALEKLLQELPKQYKNMGINVEEFKGSIQKVGDNQALVFEHKTLLPGLPIKLYQRQYMVPGGGKTFAVTCTCKNEDMAKYGPIFDSIAGSLKVPAPTVKSLGFNWGGFFGGGASGAVIGGIAGACVGLLVGIVALIKKALSGKPAARPADRA